MNAMLSFIPFRLPKWRWIVLFIVIWFVGSQFLTDWDKHYPIQGKVIDAQTRRPVVGAVVGIYWVREKWGFPGLGSNRERYGSSDAVTDAEGRFSIPKYPHGSHVMGVYKEGYLCWSSEKQYHPEGRTDEEKYVRRIWHRVKKGMVVELEPINGNNFPAYEHARFVSLLGSRIWSARFFQATEKEQILQDEERKKFKEKWR